MGTKVQEWYGNEVIQQNIFAWIIERETCWEIPHNIYTEWIIRKPAVIKNWLRVPEYHSIHASPTRDLHYDYVLDIDVPKLGIARKIEMAIIEVLTEFKIEPTLITFTSNRGFHNWFFQEMFYLWQLDWGKYTETTFELFYKVSTHFLRDLVAEKLRMERKPFQKWIEVKIARSMVRVPYCFHLGTKGVEIPITIDQVLEIERSDAQIENISEVLPLKLYIKEESGELWLDTVGDYYHDNKEEMDDLYRKPDFVQIEGLGIYAGKDVFPPCVFAKPQQGNRRKCAGFLANFLYYCNWTEEKITEYMQRWFKTIEQQGVARDGHKFYWNQVKKIITHLDKNRLFLPGCKWLQSNNLCSKNEICKRMKLKHPRFYVFEKQKRELDRSSPTDVIVSPINEDDIVDEEKLIRFTDRTIQ